VKLPTVQLSCAVYARVSTDKQNPLSPDDQIRKCQEFADQNGIDVLDEHVYIDEGLSGAGMDRPSFQRMLTAAYGAERPFSIILVDDTSRLSRSLPDAMRTIENLRFAGLRVIFISQGIDTCNEQSDVQVTVHGLVDSLYVKELGKKTHRGLEGLVLRGLHAGGRCYGYTSVPAGEGNSKRLEINESEAANVRRIFELSAEGSSLKAIAKRLNFDHIEPPRSRTARRGEWCPTAIRAMLKRELYKGEVVWNRSKFEKEPGTNRRRRKIREKGEWKRIHHPELAIVSLDLWQRVQQRLTSFGGEHKFRGLVSRSQTSPYLFSGLLKCGECGGNLIIGTGGGTHRHPKYVCSNYFNRGTCTNDLYIRREQLEERLLGKLQSELLRKEVVDYALEEFGRQLRNSLSSLSSEISQLRQRKEKLEREIRNFSDAIAEHGHSAHLFREIATREAEIASITQRLLYESKDCLEAHLSEMRQFVEEGIADLRDLLTGNPITAKAELRKHLMEVRMIPTDNHSEWHYVAEGTWDLLAGGGILDRTRQTSDWRIRMVAGVGFEPTTFGL
jgi:site-specific DNA recombinase